VNGSLRATAIIAALLGALVAVRMLATAA